MACKGLLGSRGQAQSGKPTQICDSRAHQSSNAWQDTASFGRVSGGSAVLSILQRVAWERSPKDPIKKGMLEGKDSQNMASLDFPAEK